MPGRTNCSPPDILCTCGATRVYPIGLGLPPLGVEAKCLERLRSWKLDEYTFSDDGGTRWSWTAEDLPEAKSKNLNRLVRNALGVEAALAGLGLTWRARGTC